MSQLLNQIKCTLYIPKPDFIGWISSGNYTIGASKRNSFTIDEI